MSNCQLGNLERRKYVQHSGAPNGYVLTNICSYEIFSWLAKNMNRSILHFFFFFHIYYNLLKLLLAYIVQIIKYNTFRFKYKCFFISIGKYGNSLLFGIHFIQKSRFYGKFLNSARHNYYLQLSLSRLNSLLRNCRQRTWAMCISVM